MPSAKGMDAVEACSTDIYLPTELGINQLGESYKVRNSTSWQYLTELILDVIKYPEVGTKEIPTPPTTSEPNHNPIGPPSSAPGISAPGFGDPSGDPSGSTSDNTTNYPSPVTIINPPSVPSKTTDSGLSEIPTKDLSHVTKDLSSAKPSNMLI